MTNPRSTAALFGHPLHPMLIAFPVTLYVATAVVDIIFWFTANASWASVSQWTLGIGVVTALLAGLAGFIDFMGDSRIRSIRIAWWHFLGNVIVTLIEIANFSSRYSVAPNWIIPWGMTLSILAVLLMFGTAWLGGELVFRHRVAVL